MNVSRCYGRGSLLRVDSAIFGRLARLLEIGAKARINSQDGEALEEARNSPPGVLPARQPASLPVFSSLIGFSRDSFCG